MSDFPDFCRQIPNRGYQWWYVDATSADGRDNLVIIAFVGSVFSPFYARACGPESNPRPADPMDYCAINAALYRRDGKRWVLTEKPRAKVRRSNHEFVLDQSRLAWDGQAMTIDICERAVPIPRSVRGTVTVTPRFVTDRGAAQRDLNPGKDPGKHHQWWPFAPHCEVQVTFDQPDWRWSGSGYFDTNQGSEPLHEGFEDWNWSRSHQADCTRLTYNATGRDGQADHLALAIDASGRLTTEAVAPRHDLKRGLWGMAGQIHLNDPVATVSMLEDTPFYTRSMIHTDDHQAVMHESLSLARFRQRWVQFLLPFKTRRQRL